jgi:hypothetical protein
LREYFPVVDINSANIWRVIGSAPFCNNGFQPVDANTTHQLIAVGSAHITKVAFQSAPAIIAKTAIQEQYSPIETFTKPTITVARYIRLHKAVSNSNIRMMVLCNAKVCNRIQHQFIVTNGKINGRKLWQHK